MKTISIFLAPLLSAQWMTSVMADPTTTAEPAVASCVNSCAASDSDCQASCVGVPAASNSALVSSATNCMAKCPQGNAQAYPDCIEGCINSYFLTSTSIPTMGGTTVSSAYGTPTSGALLTATAVTTTKATTGPAAESSEASSLSQVASSISKEASSVASHAATATSTKTSNGGRADPPFRYSVWYISVLPATAMWLTSLANQVWDY